MSDINLDALVEDICKLDLINAAALVKKLEDKLGLQLASFNMAQSSGDASNSEGSSASEKTDYSVTLEKFDASKKISVIKVVRELTGLGLKEAKEFVEGCPKAFEGKFKKDEVEKIKAKLAEVGAECKVE